MDKKTLLALLAASCSLDGAMGRMSWGAMDCIDYLAGCLDMMEHYDLRKRFSAAQFELKQIREDVQMVATYAADGLNKIQQEAAAQKYQFSAGIKPGVRPRDEWAVEMVNDAVQDMASVSFVAQAVSELLAEVPVAELQNQTAAIASLPDKLAAFQNGVFTEVCRALNDSDVLDLTNKLVTPAEAAAAEEENPPPSLLVQLAKKSPVALHTLAAPATAVPEGVTVEHHKFEFQEIRRDTTLGVVKGICIPAGNPKRTYHEGQYFPADVVFQTMVDWEINSPLINTEHDQVETYTRWEHPHYRVIESFQAPCDYEENGTKIYKGDWVQTWMAISDEGRKAIADLTFNGFSWEGDLAFAPGDYLTTEEDYDARS